MTCRLSIVIPSHCRADLLRRCLTSVTRHAPSGTEILVVDDASPGTAVSRTAAEFVGVDVLHLPRKTGFSVAANSGIEATGAPFVEVLNDDTEVTEDWAEAALSCFEDARVVAVAPLVLQPSDSRRSSSLPPCGGGLGWGVSSGPRPARVTPHPSPPPQRGRGKERNSPHGGWEEDGEGTSPGRPRESGPSEVQTIDSAGDDYDVGGFARKRGRGQSARADSLTGCEVFGASASSAFYRRDALARVGMFPTSFGAYFEDVDLSFRLRRVGAILFEPTSRVLHHGGQSYCRLIRTLVEQQSCNEERVYWRNLPDALLRRSLPRHAAVLAAKAARRCLEGRLLPWVIGRIRAWRQIPADRRHAHRLDEFGCLRPW